MAVRNQGYREIQALLTVVQSHPGNFILLISDVVRFRMCTKRKGWEQPDTNPHDRIDEAGAICPYNVT